MALSPPSTPIKKTRKSCTSKNDDIIKKELRRLSSETEYIPRCRKDGKMVMAVSPTSRAELAKRGFIIRQTLGSGTYSKVKVARNVSNKQLEVDYVAVKIIDRLKAPHDYQNVFLPREVRIWPSLEHPNIVRLHDIFCDSQRIYMILEYAPYGDALIHVQNHGAVQENKARAWMSQVCSAVRYMHDRDITHRDLKLENILIAADGSVRIADFGFVKPDSSCCLSETYCGSKSYAAPEIQKGQPYDPKKADTWALGVVLYIMVTGKMPFDETKGTTFILREQEALRLYWPQSVSMAARDLILYCFTYVFTQRPGVNELQEHNWFKMETKKPRNVA